MNRLLVHGQDLFAGTTQGVWRRPLSHIACLTAEKQDIASAFCLGQNYPNPFNPATVISYQLPVTCNMPIVLYDLLGREVAVLVNERKSPGVHEAKFDGAGLASSVYLYRLTAGNFIQTREMIVADEYLSGGFAFRNLSFGICTRSATDEASLTPLRLLECSLRRYNGSARVS
jgi:hypothetical protein